MWIWELFEGYEKAHGRYDVKRVNDKGKNEGRAVTVKEPLTQHHWDNHIAGTGPGIGVIPLKQDNTVRWGCIDIDVIGIDHKELEDKCKRMSLPLVICRSKSGGAHAFLFLKEDTDARIVIDALSSWSASLGYGGCEIFPKQSSRYDEVNDIGNWLNMPYFYAERTNRYCVKDGKPLSLSEFTEYAESMLTDPASIEQVKSVTVDGEDLNTGLFEEGPPCLQILYSTGGFPEGTRNDGLYNVAVYLRKRFPDDWQNRLQEYNVAMCDPPLPLTDVNTIAKSGARKEYEYRCRKPPISAHCHRRLCTRRHFGVGEQAEGKGRPEISDVKKVEGDPVLWFLTITTDEKSKRIMLTTDDFSNQAIFKKRVMDAVSRMPRTLPPDRWDRFVDDLVRTAEVEPAPADSTPFDQFRIVLEQYILGKNRTTDKKELLNSSSPFITGDGEVWFKLDGLLKHLNTVGYKYQSSGHVTQMLRSAGIEADSKVVTVAGKQFNVWYMREPTPIDDVSDDPKFGTTEF